MEETLICLPNFASFFVISSALFDNSQATSGKINGASICNVVCLYLCNMRVAPPEIKWLNDAINSSY